jgi:hypothetical protein
LTSQEKNNENLTVSLKTYIDAGVRSLEGKIDSLRSLHERDIETSRAATALAGKNLELRLEKLNEMRKLLTDRETNYVQKVEIAPRLERIEEDVRELRESRAEMCGKASQTSVIVAYILSIAGFVLGFIHLFMPFLSGK